MSEKEKGSFILSSLDSLQLNQLHIIHLKETQPNFPFSKYATNIRFSIRRTILNKSYANYKR